MTKASGVGKQEGEEGENKTKKTETESRQCVFFFACARATANLKERVGKGTV